MNRHARIGRRTLLCCGAALGAGLFGSLLGGSAFADGLANPCRGALPDDLAQHDLVRSAFEGIAASRLVDGHAHLLGNGDAGSGCRVHPDMHAWWRPDAVLRRKVILDAACVRPDAASVDRAYLARLHALAADFPAGARWWLFAFDHACDDDGRERPDWSTFHVPNDYARQVARAWPLRYDWVASIHPYREDALARLAEAHRDGAVAVKWLPSAMNIALGDARCRAFYDRLAALGLPLVVHCGEEKAVPGAGRDAYGNPLLVRHPLAHGVTVIVAHAASLGQAEDLDRRSRPRRPAFELFGRLMDERGHDARLLADISAVFQSNRESAVWRAVLERDDWHPRLLHGSDHPLPGVMPLFAPQRLVDAGLLAPAAVEPLRRIRAHNPLLFDFVLKRQLRANGRALPTSVFEARALPAATVAHG